MVETAFEKTTTQGQKKESQKMKIRHEGGVIIEGVDNLLIRLSRCCNPVPGDDIVGYITKGRGISVHRKDCPNFHAMVEKDPSREILVKWDENLIETKMNKYNFTFTIVLNDRPNILMEIVNLIGNHKINITSLNSYEVKKDGDKVMKVKISIEIKGKTEYDYLINNILKLKDVIAVER